MQKKNWEFVLSKTCSLNTSYNVIFFLLFKKKLDQRTEMKIQQLF